MSVSANVCECLIGLMVRSLPRSMRLQTLHLPFLLVPYYFPIRPISHLCKRRAQLFPSVLLPHASNEQHTKHPPPNHQLSKTPTHCDPAPALWPARGSSSCPRPAADPRGIPGPALPDGFSAAAGRAKRGIALGRERGGEDEGGTTGMGWMTRGAKPGGEESESPASAGPARSSMWSGG